MSERYESWVREHADGRASQWVVYDNEERREMAVSWHEDRAWLIAVALNAYASAEATP